MAVPLLGATAPIVTLEVVDGAAAEPGLDTGCFRVVLSTTAASPLTVVLARSGTATDGADCSAMPGTVVIPAGQTSALVPVLPLDDGLAEAGETVVLTIAAGTGYTVGAAKSGTVIIADDEPLTLSISASDSQASEPAAGAGGGTFTITRTGLPGPALTIPYAVSGTASAGKDYSALGGSVTFPADAVTATIALAVLDDASTEVDETVTVTLPPGAGYVLAAPSATITVLDDEPPVLTVSVSDGTAAEPGTDAGTFLVKRAGRKSAALTVACAIGGTATPGSDFTALPTTVTLAANAASATVTVTPVNDAVAEDDETVTLSLAAGMGYALGTPSTGTVKILDDEWGLAIAATDPVAFEPASDTGTFTVTRSGPGSTAAALTIPYTISGSATAGTDYVAMSGSVTIPATKKSATITVTPRDDTLLEGVETVEVTLGAVPGCVLRTPTAIVRIGDNESANPTITVAVPDAAAAEAGQDPGRFTISRTGPTGSARTVAYTVGGTATNGSDIVSLSGTAIIPVGATSVDVTVTPLQDSASEVAETVVLTLVPAADQILGTAKSGTVTIADDDAPTVSISAKDNAASEPGAGKGNGQFTVTRKGALGAALTVQFAASGTATAGADYTPLPATLTIPANAASATLTVTPLDDAIVEPVETVIASLSAGAGYAVQGSSSATVSLDDDEIPVVSIAPGASAAENGSPKGSFVLTRLGRRTSALTIALGVSGTATAGTDFTALAATVTMAANATSTTVTVTPIQDVLVEGEETIVATLAGGTGYTVGSPASATVSIVDDEPGVLVAALDDEATRPDDLGLVTIRRSGALGSPLTVRLAIGGTAIPGTHYAALPTQIVIPANGTGAVLAIRPLATVTTITTVTVGVAADAAYTITPPATVTVTLRPADGNTEPTMSPIADRTIAEDGSTGAIAVTIGDAQTPAAELGFSVTADDPVLLPATGITTGGSGADRTVTVKPAANRSGVARVTATVSDGVLTTSRSFTLTVTAVNDAPKNTASPAITGSPMVGQVLTAGTGTWNDTADAGIIAGYTYQWQRADTATGSGLATIAGATASTYTPVAADLGRFLRVRVTATDAGVPLPAKSTTASSAYTAAVVPGTVAIPVLTLSDSMATGGAPIVRATTSTGGATLRYTVDGSDPSLASPVLDPGGLSLAAGTTTVRVRGWCDGYNPSAIAAGTYTVAPELAAPTAAPPQMGPLPPPWPPFRYVAPVDVALSATQGSVIRYTVDGTEPGPGSALYTAPIHIEEGVVTVKARAYSAMALPSQTASFTYWFVVAPSEFTIPSHTSLPYPVTVRTTCATPNAIENFEMSRIFSDDSLYATPESPLWPKDGYVCEVGSYTFNVRAHRPGYIGSAGSTISIKVCLPPPVVTATPAPTPFLYEGAYKTHVPLSVALSPPANPPANAPASTLRYNLTGMGSTFLAYSSPLVIDGPSAVIPGMVAVNARAYDDFNGDTQLVYTGRVEYYFEVAAPVVAIAAVAGGNRITASSITPGAEYRYTTDGSDPTTSSPLLPAIVPLAIPQVKVRGFRGYYTPSPVTTTDNVPTSLGMLVPVHRRAGT